jgi:hypothetical protein
MPTVWTNIKIDEATRQVAERMRARRGLRSLAALVAQLVREAELAELKEN